MARIDEYLKKIAGEQVTPPAPVSSLDRELSDIPEITGGGIPDITVSDVGKVLTAAEDGEGGYAPTWDTVEDGIPEITESDVGKVLTAAEDGEGGYIPAWATGGGGGVEPYFILIDEPDNASPAVIGWTDGNYATKAAELLAAAIDGNPIIVKAGEAVSGDIPDANVTLVSPASVEAVDAVHGDIRFSAVNAFQTSGSLTIQGYSVWLGGFGINVEKINYELEIAQPGG